MWKNGPGFNYCAGAPFSPAPTSFWTFDLAQTTNVAMDIMPAQNTGYFNNVLTGRGHGILRQSIYLNGTAYVDIPDSQSLRFASSGVTVSLWLYIPKGSMPSDLGRMMNVFDKQNGYSGFGLWIDSSNHPGFITGGGGSVTTTQQLQPGLVYHIAATYRPGDYLRLYINGQLAGTSTSIATMAREYTQDLRIGASAASKNNFFVGNIDEITFWTQALSATDINRVYQVSHTHSGFQ
jgi:hypothetical protein